jgi:phosphoglycolate phosphatase-like HAD superfamily hydrolase
MTVDVETGHKAGVKTVAVVTGSSSREDIAALAPFRIIDQVLEVSGILEELGIS